MRIRNKQYATSNPQQVRRKRTSAATSIMRAWYAAAGSSRIGLFSRALWAVTGLFYHTSPGISNPKAGSTVSQSSPWVGLRGTCPPPAPAFLLRLPAPPPLPPSSDERSTVREGCSWPKTRKYTKTLPGLEMVTIRLDTRLDIRLDIRLDNQIRLVAHLAGVGDGDN